MKRALSAWRHVDRIGEVGRCAEQSEQWAALTGAYLGITTLKYPYEFRLRDGGVLVLETPHDLVTTWIIFFRPEYCVAADSEVIVDAGANIGAFTLYASRRAPRARIVSIEPFPDTASRLRDTIARNGLGGRVRCREFALAPVEGNKIVDVPPSSPSQSRNVSIAAAGATRIQCTTLAKLVETEQLDRIDMFKMDIEGDEHEVLLSTPRDVLERIATFALEYHPNAPKSRIFSALAGAGLELAADRADFENSGVALFRRRGAARAS